MSADLHERVFIALGSNLGKREEYLARAVESIRKIPLTKLLATSRVEETAPLGGKDQPKYLNQMVVAATGLDPSRFLKALQKIEEEAGRVRTERWAPRTLDLDIVRFGTRRLRDHDLILPHPELPHRDFWQREIQELEQQLATLAEKA
ncbi:MAG TPA: 2-amino-4-hydroxy-6-hydroxymethyldihydropteridine diphosphokinase [Gemmatimonadales bacterium]|nr:2-amino-4-hydroxy-6-hydroxymethyldihydropteridine diphosphokinase [Gemmatimonadales bacterium]